MKKQLLLSAFLTFSFGTSAFAQLVSDGVTIAEVNNQTVITGTGAYDQVDYPNASSDYSFARNADNSVSVTKPDNTVDRLILIDGIWFQGEAAWYSIDDLVQAQAGNQTITGDPDDYDQVDYVGARADYTFVRNDDASVTVTKPNGSTDTLINIDGIWFQGDEEWHPISQLVVVEVNGARTYEGDPIEYDQVDYPGSAADYSFTQTGNSVTVERLNINTNLADDILIDIDGIWFQGEEQWYAIDTLIVVSNRVLTGDPVEYDQIDYPGQLASYNFTENADGTVTVERPDGFTDTLTDYDGFWFIGEEEWYSIEDAIAGSNPAPPPVNNPTPVDPILPGTNPLTVEADEASDFGLISAEQLGGKCFDVERFGRDNGDRIIQYGCKNPSANDAGNQLYSIASFGQLYQIRVQHTGKCLGVRGGSLSAGAEIVQTTCGPFQHLLWDIQGTGNNRQIIAQHSNMCMSVQNGSTNDWAPIIQSPCLANDPRDRFRIDGPIGAGATRNISPAGGQWAGPYPLSVIPVASAMLPDGRIMNWSAYAKMSFGGSRGETWTTIFDPANNSSQERFVQTGHDMFCPGTAVFPDGRVVVTGGSNASETSIYNPATDQWTSGPDMIEPRGYNAMTPLADGSILNMGGSWSGGTADKAGEVWTGSGGWQSKTGLRTGPLNTTDRVSSAKDNHMWLFAAPNGLVFQAGPSRRTHWLNVSGNGSITASALRGNDDRMNGNAVMYDIGQILTMGGAADYHGSNASSSAHVIDINGGINGTNVRQVGNMNFPRTYLNSVVLPSGEVVVFGGQREGRGFTDELSIMTAEIWNPVTEQFSLLHDMAVPRNYHSVALLMKDGRVYTGGGGLCGGCAANHADVEIFTPPYLLNADGTAATRPVLSNVPRNVTYGDTVNVTLDTSVNHNLVLVRTGAVTHSINNDQRRVPVAAVRTGNQFSFPIPNRNVAIPGQYFLFAINADGVPSIAETITIE